METGDSNGFSVSRSSDTTNGDGVCRREKEKDIISNFPDPLLHYIFSSRFTDEVVRMSVLSRRWRYLWHSIPYLNLDSFVNREQIVHKFTNFVNSVLIIRDGSTMIQRFRLACPSSICSSTVNTWIQYAANRNVQELDLKFYPEEEEEEYFTGCCANEYSLHNLSSLEEVLIDLEESRQLVIPYEEHSYSLIKIMKGFYNVKVPILFLPGLEGLASALDISTSFLNLKSLKLITGDDEYHFKMIAQLIACSPNLEELDIEIDDRFCGERRWEWKNVEFECVMDNLKRVEIFDMDDGRNELEFVQFLLKNGKVLDKMVFTWYSFDSRKRKMETIRKVLTFPRASSSIAISFPEKTTKSYVTEIFLDTFKDSVKIY